MTPGQDRRDAELQRFLDEILRREAGVRRSRSRWLRQAAEEESTFVGMLRGLSDARSDAVVTTRDGTLHRGVLTAPGRDFVIISDAAASVVIVPIAAVASVRTVSDRSSAPVAAAEGSGRDLLLAEVLAGLAGDRPDVLVHADGERGSVSGRLHSAGADVLTVRLHANRSLLVHLPLRAVISVALA